MSNPSSKLPTQACPALLCFPAVTDQTQPPLPKTQRSAQTRTFQLNSSCSSSSLGHLPFSNRMLQMPWGCHLIVRGQGQLAARASTLTTAGRPSRKEKAPVQSHGRQRGSWQEHCLQLRAQGLSLRLAGSWGVERCRYTLPDLSPLQQCIGADSWPLLPATLPSSHLPAPSNPVEGLEAPTVSSETSKAVSWGSAEGYRGGI